MRTLAEERARGLAKAQRILAERRVIRERIAAGDAYLSMLIRAEPSEALRNARVGMLVRWQPKVGKVKAKKLLDRSGLHSHMLLKELTWQQRYRLADLIEDRERVKHQ